jgi:hypothetical protein
LIALRGRLPFPLSAVLFEATSAGLLARVRHDTNLGPAAAAVKLRP